MFIRPVWQGLWQDEPHGRSLVAVGGGGEYRLGAGVGDDHVVLVVGAADSRRFDAPLDAKHMPGWITVDESTRSRRPQSSPRLEPPRAAHRFAR